VFDTKLRPVIDGPLNAGGRRLAALGVGADQVTIAGFAIGIGAALAIAMGAFGLGLVLIGLNRLADGLDGAIARATQATDRGGFLDIALDFGFYAAIPLAFAVHDPASNALPAAFLIASFLANGTTFLAFAISAAKRDLTTTDQGAKSFFYMAGIAEGAETIAVFCAFCLWPDGFPWLAGGFAVLCFASASARVVAGWRSLR
jgi:phosphatidylglycerophosphate synthase